MGQRLKLAWQESPEELKARYVREQHVQRRTRLQVLWQLRMGKRLQDVAATVGVNVRVIQRWVAWYRDGGLEAVMQRVTGHGARGMAAYLSDRQQRALIARVALGDFRTVWDVIHWVEGRWGVVYTYDGMYTLLKRHKLGLKVPRPQSEKADQAKQEAWKKGG
jgi:transposase